MLSPGYTILFYQLISHIGRFLVPWRINMNNALHFVGFKDDRYNAAIKVFGTPDFIHRVWDKRAVDEVMENDVVVFADDPQDVKPFAYDDSANF